GRHVISEMFFLTILTLRVSGLSRLPWHTGHGLVDMYCSRSRLTPSLSVWSNRFLSAASTPSQWVLNVRSWRPYFMRTWIVFGSPYQTALSPSSGILLTGRLESKPHSLPTASSISGHQSLTSP